MKILIIQENGQHEKNRHMRECHSLVHYFSVIDVEAVCWGKGHENFSTPFEEIIKDYDIIFCLENYDNGWLPDLSSLNHYKVFWSIDSHCELKSHIKFCVDSKINLHLNSNLHYIQYFEKFVEKNFWFPNAVDTRWWREKPVKKNVDIGFLGSNIEKRQEVFPFLQDTIGLSTFSGVTGEEAVELINKFKIGFNLSIADDINYRTFETGACKVPLITNVVPGLENLFVLDEEIVTYNNLKEMLGACVWLLKDDVSRKQIAENGYRKIVEKHTYAKRTQLLKEILDNI